MSLLPTIGHLVKKAPQLIDNSVGGAAASLQGLLYSGRRHDSPQEKEIDRIRAQINDSHRFNSFADQRSGNFVKWHIDGHDFFYAVSEILDSAREMIMIMDWWLTPEIYLRRPPAYHKEWRIDRLLKRKAEQGVKVYIIVYKEVLLTTSMASHHTEEALQALHPNIAVMRHPDHIGSKDDVEFWSHHEKVVIVDNHRASVGGLDLCFGRWDTHNHPLADVHPTKFSRTLFPGQDYNNARLLDFHDVDNFVSNQLSLLDAPRMGWHDVHMTLVGSTVLDIVQHFVERWNEIKRRKYQKDNRFDWLALPHDVALAPNEAVVHHPHREKWQVISKGFQQQFNTFSATTDPGIAESQAAPGGSMNVQVVRSVSDWSHGVLTEKSIQNAYISLIQEANHFIYIENQFFISTTQNTGPVKNQIAKALVERILRAARDRQRFKVVVVIPELPGFAGDISGQTAIKTILAAQWRTINRGGYSIYEEITNSGYDPTHYIRFYHLRSYDRINAPYSSFISQIEQKSGVTFHEAQVALGRIWLGESYDHTPTPGTHGTGSSNSSSNDAHTQPKKVAIKIPQPTLEGIFEAFRESSKKTVEIEMPKTMEEATDIVKRFERGALGIRGDENVLDSVTQHVHRDRTSLADEMWLGTEEEERNAYVSELLYIHSKVMIVDDRRVIMGSANLNDRSQKGDGDSEIALVIEDTEEIESHMNGSPHSATRFAASLRRKLYREHLGLIPPQNVTEAQEPIDPFMRPAPYPNPDETQLREDALVADPLSDEVLQLWEGTAKRNSDIFTEIFRPVPTDLVQNWEVYKKYVPKVMCCHVVPEVSLDHAKKQLAQVHGHLVEMPLRFLIEEKELIDNTDWKGLNPTLPVYI